MVKSSQILLKHYEDKELLSLGRMIRQYDPIFLNCRDSQQGNFVSTLLLLILHSQLQPPVVQRLRSVTASPKAMGSCLAGCFLCLLF